jgi:uncharacterized protein YqeY
MTSKNPEDENRIIPPSESESHIDRKSTADKLGSHAVNAVAKDQLRTSGDYRGQINEILSAPLTPETFDGYAENALNEVIAVADEMIVQYLHRKGLSGMPVTSLVEDSIAGNYEISIDSILDDLKHKADEIKKIQKSVEEISKDSRVYVPPDSEDIQITNGSVEFEIADTAPKVETILFMLQENYGLEVDNREDIKLISGTVSPEMMRNEPYVLIDIPSLNRIILACNEKGNITYVFDQGKIKEAEISLDKLVDYTKKQLDDIIRDFESIGIRITHNSKYLPKIEEALSSIKHFAKTGEKAIEDNPEIQDPTLLQKTEKATEDILSITKISYKLRTSTNTLKNIYEDHSDEFGDVSKYLFGSVTAMGFNKNQVAIFEKYLPSASKAPEGALSIHGIADKYGLSDGSITKIYEEHVDEIGEATNYRFGPRIAEGYTEEQVAIFEKYLPTASTAPEDFLSLSGIARKNKASSEKIKNIYQEHSDEIGDVQEYKFHGNIALGFNEEQVAIIEKYLPSASNDDILSLSGIAKHNKVDHGTVKKIYQEHSDEIGELQEYRFGPATALGFTEEQVAIFEKYLPTASKATDSITSLNKLAKNKKVDVKKLEIIIDEHSDEIGDVRKYKFRAKTSRGVTQEQIAIIEKYLPSIPTAHDGVLSLSGISKKYKAGSEKIKNIIEEHSDEIGNVQEYRFGPRIAEGYTVEQMAIIEKYL